jgi:hypothetical protein
MTTRVRRTIRNTVRALLTIGALAQTGQMEQLPLAAESSPEPVSWVTGVIDDSGPPEGVLLSENEGYWGDCVLTGVDYRYESEADNPPDRIANQAGTFGRRLLDGRVGGDWHVPVGQSHGPLKVVFDFKRPCELTEVDTVCVRNPRTALTFEVSDTGERETWRTVLAQSLGAAADTALQRNRLPTDSKGRFLRVSIEAEGITYADEVIVWGRGEVSDAYPERIAPTYRLDRPAGTLESIPGIEATRFPRARFAAWRESLGRHAASAAVWAQAAAPSPTAPILPEAEQIGAPLQIIIARNETESVYLTLTNTSAEQPLTVTVNNIAPSGGSSEGAEPRLRARLLVGGALPAVPPKRRLTAEQRLRLLLDGTMPEENGAPGQVRVLPFFEQGRMLGPNLMERYLTNGCDISDYPRLRLLPGGSAVFMLRVTTDHAPAGRYTGRISATTAGGATVAMPLTVNVADVVLTEPDLWIRSWGNGTRQFPFETRTRLANDARVNRELGVTVWEGFPTPGSKAELFGSHGRTYYRATAIPSHYVHVGYCNQMKAEDLTAEDEQRVAAHLRDLVDQARGLGLNYDQWWVELWDEPQESNTAFFAALARIIKKTDPRVRIYMNPLFWRPGHAPPEAVVEHLAPWYNELVDISVPVSSLVRDDVAMRELWAQPRFVRAFFLHPASRAGRGMAWRAFELGFNGWGYYCYYAPYGNPWDIRTWSSLDYSYQMVFPGPDGPIPMPIYEVMRDGWEDYRLLTALRRQGKDQLVDELLAAFRRNEPPAALRLKALDGGGYPSGR